jgi:chemotaxis protein methyltransferase CheR
MAELELLPSVFSILSGLVDEKVGLHYGLLDKDILHEKASARAIETGFSSLLDYYYFLRYDDGGEQELAELVETLVINETFLFREWPAIEVLVNSFVKPWCAAGRRPRIWSAACATGEEPLSLAMLLNEHGLLDKVDIYATDISSNALAKARAGRYSKRTVRTVPDQKLLERYVEPHRDGYGVSKSLIDQIRWSRLNLLSDTDVAALGVFDIIICRNVMIYFSDNTVRSLLERLSRSMVQDGVLAVGVSESLLRYGSGFVGEEHSGVFVYRKATQS